jgi:hypothetical protein
MARPSSRVPLQSLLAGVIAAVLLYAAVRLMRTYDWQFGQYGKLVISLAMFVIGGFAGGRAVAREGSGLRLAVTSYGALLIGVALGVVVWSAVEDQLFGRAVQTAYQERKIFPVNVMLSWLLGWAPLMVGLAVGTFTGKSTDN